MKLSRKVTVTIAVGIGLMLSSVGVASASPHYTDWSGTSGIKAELDMRMDQSTRSSFESKLEASKEQVRAKVYKGSSQAWGKFEPYLNGVFDKLFA